MSEVVKHLEQAGVLIAVNASLERFTTGDEATSLKDRLSRYMQDLMTDLSLPVSLSFEVRLAGDMELSSLYSYRVRIQGEQCRTQLPATVPQAVSAGDFALLLAHVIYENRELFITLPLCEKLCQQWLADQGEERQTVLSAPELQRLCTLLVQRGFGMQHVRENFMTAAKKLYVHGSIESLFEEIVAVWETIALAAYFSKDRFNTLAGAQETQRLESLASGTLQPLCDRVRDNIFRDLGVILPQVTIGEDTSLENQELRLRLNDVRLPPLRVFDGLDTVDSAFEETLQAFASRNVGAFLVTDTVKYYLNVLRKTFALLVQTTLALFDEQQLTSILRSVVDEGISIKDVRTILEGLAGFNGIVHIDTMKRLSFLPSTAIFYPVAEGNAIRSIEELGIDDYADCARIVFRLPITNIYLQPMPQGGYALPAFRLDPALIERMRSVDTQPLSDEEYDQLMWAIHDALESLPPEIENPIILTDSSIRKRFRKHIEKEFPQLPVLSIWEILPVPIIWIAHVALSPTTVST